MSTGKHNSVKMTGDGGGDKGDGGGGGEPSKDRAGVTARRGKG